ncbi:hypothetical protein L249_8411 [Ophiocordyceps polyrhachis-furcata BCC 54312]|uniref:Uncharacterized protein n=1 Tax=Ophiocordyceps polyrhachis-furcata BCC 54312 TaxID=1330021 RepID=A0A367L6Q2_9HYPO|nr:hypothetical protein L249_8411 [Ophiocordyceps polyrhachis-furcata BCC 54312]
MEPGFIEPNSLNEQATVEWLETQDPGVQKSQAASLFARLLEEAKNPKSTSGQACPRLAGLVSKSLGSSSNQLRDWAFSKSVTLDLFHFYIDWDDADRHRSVKLLLDLIAQSVIKNPDRDEGTQTKQCIIDSLISTVTGRAVKPAAKSAMTCLDYFIKSGTLTLDDVFFSYSTYRKEPVQLNRCQVWRHFITDLFRWMGLHFVSLSAGRLVVSIYRCWRQENRQALEVPSVETWFEWLVGFACQDPILIDPIKNYILFPLFRDDRLEGLRFLDKINEAVSTHQHIDKTVFHLAALESGTRAGLVECSSSKSGCGQGNELPSLTLSPSILGEFLAQPDERVRILSLSVLVTSPSTTAPYTIDALKILRTHLSSLFSETNARVREQTSGKLRDMFRRLRGAIHVLTRSTSRSMVCSRIAVQLTECLEYHQDFLHFYMAFLCNELVPTASYQRHIASLKAANFILRMEAEAARKWKMREQLLVDFFDDKWMRALFDLLMDPFDDVRDGAATALKRLYIDFTTVDKVETPRTADAVVEVSRRAEELARRTSRADHSDGSSRVAQLHFLIQSAEEQTSCLKQKVRQLERKVSGAEKDLASAVLYEPLHGDLASLNRLWQVTMELKLSQPQLDAVTALQLDMVSLCERVWKAVRDVLCYDSPEGHLPHELEEVEGLETKSLLSFSFRAVNEASNLLRIMVLTTRNGVRNDFVSPTREVFERIGAFAFDQLASLRHRGALTTAGLLFATFCQQAKKMDTDLDMWYQEALRLIFSVTSTTRRSAGLPTIITGLLAANAHPSFEQIMDKLISIASLKVQGTGGLPQVHSYNCLREIFKVSSTNGRQWEEYLSPCLQLAANGLRSDVWAIRNSGLMLLRSLVDCLFGSHESKAMIETGWDGKANRLAYHRYPGIEAGLRDVLVSGHETLEGGISVLEIIRRGGPPESLRDEIEAEVQEYLACSFWQVRELAARTLSSCLLSNRRQWLPFMQGLFEKALEEGDPNLVHGILLTFKAVIQRLSEVAVDRLEVECPILTTLLSRYSIETRFVHCSDVVAAYVQVLNTVWSVQKANSRKPTPLAPIYPRQNHSIKGSVLLGKSTLIHKVYAAAASFQDDSIKQLRTLLLNQPAEVDTTSALREMADLFHSTASEQTVAELAELYVELCHRKSPAQTEALHSLIASLETLLGRGKTDMVPTRSVKKLWHHLCSQPIGPSLSYQIIRLSATIAILNGPPSLPAWAEMISEAGQDHQPLDSRLAASHALHSFFFFSSSSSSLAANPPINLDDETSLPALLALYDALSDDDEEVRAKAASAVQSVIQDQNTTNLVVPIEASRRLVNWLANHHGKSTTFKNEVADRIVGHKATTTIIKEDGSTTGWKPASQLLQTAKEEEEKFSLFATEKQNLYFEEIRETKSWLPFLPLLLPLRHHHHTQSQHTQSSHPEEDDDDDDDDDDEPSDALERLTGWLIEGLPHLGQMGQDGPLGWSSKPRVFAICSRLILASVALIRLRPSPALCEAARDARERLRTRDVSRLLTDGWEDASF